MHGVKRVVLFCVMIAVLPTVLIITPLYLRHMRFADVKYSVAESDILAMIDGISSIFCQSHTLKMNSTFNAFQIRAIPELSTKRKHIRLKKSMVLPDDTLEYWGFYLLKGATVNLKVCSRYEGSRILVVRGERSLRTCGLMEHNFKKFGATLDKDHNKVNVTFETAAQEISVDEWDDNNIGNDTNVGGEDFTGDDVNTFIKQKLRKANKSNGGNKVNNMNSNLNKTSSINKTNSTYKSKSNTGNLDSNNLLLDNEQIEDHVGLHEKHRKRHVKHHQAEEKRVNRTKRDLPSQMLDTRITHGGNALNYTQNDSGSSVSSFETNLLTCYDGQILLTRGFSPSHLCTDVHYLEEINHMHAVHEVATDGYYYYIFYSDNDIIVNDIHAVFDIYKPTYQYANISESKGCINQTTCTFPIGFWSDETVIVEVPTRDGIEHEEDDITYLISTCHPRMSVYMIFPITVLFLIMGCAFI